MIVIKHQKEYFDLAKERYNIYLRKEAGQPRPWTYDLVLRRYRFCNVHREMDKTTKWFRENVRHKTPYPLIATVMFRWYNRIETGETILPFLLGQREWNKQHFIDALETQPPPHLTGAYMVKTLSNMPKYIGIATKIDECMPRLRQLQDESWPTLKSLWEQLRKLSYMGNFTSYEVVSDLRWTPMLREATDIMTWASAGPGCARGLGWVMYANENEFNYSSDAHQERMQLLMRALLEASKDPENWPAEWPAWEMREVEHWACETWKYVKARFHGKHLKGSYQ